MVKHRVKKKEEPKKKMTKWQLVIPIILGAGGVGIAFGVSYIIAGPPPLTQCIPSEEMQFSQNAYLHVTLDGEPFAVPTDVGIEEDCVRPLHSHDDFIVEEGVEWIRIHSAYVKPTRLTLYDFVNLWGLDLEQYDVKAYARTPGEESFHEVDDIRNLVLSSNIKVKMELLSR